MFCPKRKKKKSCVTPNSPRAWVTSFVTFMSFVWVLRQRRKEVLSEHRCSVSWHRQGGGSGEVAVGRHRLLLSLFQKIILEQWIFLQLPPLCQREGIFFTLWVQDLRGALMLSVAGRSRVYRHDFSPSKMPAKQIYCKCKHPGAHSM